MRVRHAVLAAALTVACLLAALVGPMAPRAVAGGPSRAVVVADSGTGVVVRGIEFEGDSISGIEALQLAGLAPVLQGFTGEGGAVCAISGVGCPSDDSCLTCDGRGYYWSYWRAPAGSSAYSYSRVGAGATRVHDGDVEAWRWGTGSAPAYRSFTSVFSPAPPPPPPAPGPGGGSSGNAAGGGTTGGGSSGGAVAGPTATSAPAAGATATSVATPGEDPVTTSVPSTTSTEDPTNDPGPDGDATTDDADEIAFQAAQGDRPDPADEGRGWLASVALSALTLAVIAALVVRARRQRRA